MKQNVFSVICSLLLLPYFACSQQREFHSLEEALKTPDSVRILILKKKHLTHFPSDIYKLKNLEKLSLSRNSISQIPDSISVLIHLHYIDLSSNYIESLPCAMASLPLDTLVLWDNQIYVFDTCFSTSSLKYLDLRAITMTKDEQNAILLLFPKAKIRRNRPCNCGR
jgi:Leucine-rich repeat (LRR) protein